MVFQSNNENRKDKRTVLVPKEHEWLRFWKGTPAASACNLVCKIKWHIKPWIRPAISKWRCLVASIIQDSFEKTGTPTNCRGIWKKSTLATSRGLTMMADNALSEKPILKLEADVIEFVWTDEESWNSMWDDDEDASALIDADNPCLCDKLPVPELLLSIVHTEIAQNC